MDLRFPVVADARRQMQAPLGGGLRTSSKAAPAAGRLKRRAFSPETVGPLPSSAAGARGLDARELVRLKARKLSPIGEAACAFSFRIGFKARRLHVRFSTCKVSIYSVSGSLNYWL